MDLYVYDEKVSIIGIIDEYSSLMWIRRFSSAGAFELYVPATPHNIALLQPHRYIYRDDVDEAMYISTVKEKKTDDENTLTISGYSLDGLFRKRCIPAKLDRSSMIANLEQCTHFGCETVFYDPDKYDSGTTAQETFNEDDNAETYMRFVLKKSKCFMHGRLNVAERRLEFTLKKAKDLSEKVIFSEDYDNLTNSNYEFSEEGCGNVIYGRCKKPSSDVECPNGLPTYTIGSENTGLAASEKVLLVDPVIELGFHFVANGEFFNVEEYNFVNYDRSLAVLKEKCDAEFKNYTENFSADITVAEQYRRDFDIGDTVAIQNDLRNIRYYKPVEEVEETFDATGYVVSPTFGDPLKTIYDYIKY